ncbi:uncharacterized protein LAESUDRAFT_754921 [Laetiporus sulphureus 93-53]|uniref:Mid2 domain-containing protein n=1 Tax=Laetiporus sulphureus 93-53 TaxID=1314785 RepID=A0A165H553_9APHY|nr:uncharacterized protein LAESUDRAFT_754921 [Laetiporus sulphureus 93-53]KZT11256.1 hypothetical protein LAESUDRAFT_754921 [Laetiporus sulphureus 93-53]
MRFSLCAALIFSFRKCVLGTLTNRTIDDENGDSVTGLQPIYLPSDDWHNGTSCPTCLVQPNIAETFEHSWHATTASPSDPSPRNVTLIFNGTAIWVYCVIPNYVEWATTFTNISFELDGDTVGSYSHLPSASTDMAYNVTVYSNASMENKEHTLTMTSRRDVNSSFLVFDWAKYTYDSDPPVTSSTATSASIGTTSSEKSTKSTKTSAGASVSSTSSSSSTPSSSSRSPIGAIVGGVVGGVGALVIAVLVFLYIRRRGGRGADRIWRVDGGNARRHEIDERELMAKIEPYVNHPVTTQVEFPNVNGPFEDSETVIEVPQSTHTGPATNIATVASSAAPTIAAASSAINVPSRINKGRRTKAAIRREELSRQMRDMEQQVADLQRRQSRGGGAFLDQSSRPTANPFEEEVQVHDDSELRRQIEVLQLEVERLRAEQAAAMDEPPPAYYEPEEDSEHLADRR